MQGLFFLHEAKADMSLPPEKLDAIKEELQQDVRQSLALERTVMANERTLMAFLRTMVAISGAGLTIQHFSNSVVVSVIGYLLIPAGLAIGYFGWRSYRNRKRFIDQDTQLLGLRIMSTRGVKPPRQAP